MSDVVTKNTLSKKKRSNCTICRDVFHMPEEVYSTHEPWNPMQDMYMLVPKLE